MAKVSLRIYNREIESLIDQNHLDEAVAHCHHILQTFPKHLETYRLLGKAYLESKQYTEAVDIFSRVLMAVPDDFVSHVGMSIIRDDENKLDDAIWHMERAFESQPSNAAIQGELQRLFGRRDGVEPPKIRMTRGALAHMYFQGELYPQAISEIRAVLSQDSQRTDMQVLLARAYFHGGQKADASDMCSQLLKRYPYCFDANRIMVELLPASDRAENTQVYRHRVNELDPYAMFAKESIFHSNEVPDASVNLERLEYSGQSVEMAPDWGTAIGIGLSSGSSISSEQPDWLKAGFSESEQDASVSPGSVPVSSQEATPASQGDSDIPDFLREAGWTESRGRMEEPASLDTSREDDLTPANIPDWLKSQMPSEPEPPPPPKQTISSGDVPDWLSGLGSSEAAEATSAAEIPDWLQDLGKEESEQQTAQPEPEPKGEASTSADLTPDWLSSFAEPESKQPEPTIEPPQTAPRAASLETLGTTEKEQDDAVAWLEMLAAKHGAKPEELVTDPNARKETPPEWVEQARSIAESQSEEQPVAPEAEEDETGIWLRELSEKESPDLVSEEVKSTIPDQEIPDWLSGLDNEPPVEKAAVSEPKTQPIAQPRAEIPEWLRGLESSSVTGMEEQAEKSSEEMAVSTSPEAEEPPSVLPTAAELPEWLRGVEEEQPEEELPEAPAVSPVSEIEEPFDQTQSEPAPASSAVDLPEWLRGLDKIQPEEELPEQPTVSSLPETEEPAPVSPAVELPEWLRELDKRPLEEELPAESPVSALPESEQPAPASPVAADMSEWLQGVEEQPQEEQLSEEPSVSPLPESEESVPSPAAELPEWLRGVEETPPEEELPEEITASPLSQTEEPFDQTHGTPSPVSSTGVEMPEWMRAVEGAQQEEELSEELSASSVSETEETVTSPAAELPEWLRGIDETQPEEISEEAKESLPSWLQANLEDEEPHPAPTTPADWHPAEAQPESPAQEMEPEFDTSQPPSMPSVLQPAAELAQQEPAPRPVSVQKPERSTRVKQVESPQASAEMVNQAKDELNRGDIPAAVNHYTKLIKKGKHLDQAIRDLRESLYRYPVEVSIWQTLGDAYMRANRLQEALDAYNKAEELLR